MNNAAIILISIHILIIISAKIIGAENATAIDKYRKDFMSQLINQVPFKFVAYKLQNTAEVLKDDDVIFYLYTQKRPYDSIIINKDLRRVQRKLPVKFLVHGWTEHYYVEWCRNLTAAYLKKGNYNVIVVDWSNKGDADYMSASMSVKDVGGRIGDFIVEKLYRERKISLKNIHLISHSLGCHVAGITGQRVMQVAGKKLARITALDPAAPIFDIFAMGNNDRLSPDDANFVDIVHTDGGVLGFRNSIGTVDFYPNGGKAIQPGCSLLRPDVKYEDLFCSHARSHKIYLRSVLSKDMSASPCDSWENFASGNCDERNTIAFGDSAPNNISGTYYLRTPEDPINS